MVVNIDDNSIGKRINSIVDQCLEIDIRGAEAMKRQRLDADVSSNTSSNLFNTNAAQLRMQQQLEARKQMEERAKAEQERQAQLKAEAERQAQIRAEQERARAEQERIKAEQIRAEQLRAEQERIRAEQERQAQIRAEQERLAQVRAEQERQAQVRAEQERIAREEQERKRIEEERIQKAQEEAKKAEMERQRQLYIQEMQRKQQEEQERQKREAEEAARQEQLRRQREAEQLRLQQLQMEEMKRQAEEKERQLQEEQRRAAQTATAQYEQFENQQISEIEKYEMPQSNQQNRASNDNQQKQDIVEEDDMMHHHMMDDDPPIPDMSKIQSSNDHMLYGHSSMEQQMVGIGQMQNQQFNFLREDNTQQKAQSPIQIREDSNQMSPNQPENHPNEEPQTMTDESGNNDPHAAISSSQPQNDSSFKSAIEESIQKIDTAESSMQEQAISGQQSLQIQAPKMQFFGDKIYTKFYKQKSMKIYKLEPLSDKKFVQTEEFDCADPQESHQYLSRTISLPDDRLFIIGGATDINCTQTTKQTVELVKDPITGKRVKEQRASMYQSRAAFGIAVYPNFSQIFVAGGTINRNEATKHCERYIVDQQIWKRLPELREAKFSVSLCFFNNGSTLYCFGGLQKQIGSMEPTSTIERLSKGQNSWQILNLRLPKAQFDTGCIQINSSELLLFGGFTDSALQDVYSYKNSDPKAEGQIEKIDSLDKADFFVSNGVYINPPNTTEKMFVGHSNVYILSPENKMIRSTEII